MSVNSKTDFEDDFVDVGIERSTRESSTSRQGHPEVDPAGAFYNKWSNYGSSPVSNPDVYSANVLRKKYPKHSLVMTGDYYLLGSIYSFPGVAVEPLPNLLTDAGFIPLAPRSNPIPGVVVDSIEYGAFKLSWEKYEFLAFQIQYPQGFGVNTRLFILYEGSEEPARTLLLSAGIWSSQLHNQIWVFNQGFWDRDAALYAEIQMAKWEDVILSADFKATLRKDVSGFFSSEELYKKYSIPWKRGLLMHGPPGNGKTISLKAIMKDCIALGHAPLYVKSFQSWMGEEASMASVFNKARQLAPSVLILEDLDSLINDSNRSFFLNQLDGISGNDGLLVVATTNHFDRLDPGLSTRPSRFDRKFLFDDPPRSDRVLYNIYWQQKLASNKEISFPDILVEEIADLTAGFSFAYLKEAFVSSLVTLAGLDGKDIKFETVLKDEIRLLRKQLNKSFNDNLLDSSYAASPSVITPRRPPVPQNDNGSIRSLLDALSESSLNVDGQAKIFTGVPLHGRSTSQHPSSFDSLLSNGIWGTPSVQQSSIRSDGKIFSNSSRPLPQHPSLPGAWTQGSGTVPGQYNPLWFDGPSNNPFA